MRNKLSYDYSGEVGFVSMKSTWVDVVMSGQYVGNYQLCQHIRVASERIDIHGWSTDCEMTVSLLALLSLLAMVPSVGFPSAVLTAPKAVGPCWRTMEGMDK